jgi:hypothetical protein
MKKKLSADLRAIQERNRRVEAHKAWETSFTRRFFIALITYVTVTLFLWLIDVPKPFINALVPTGGFLLSTLSLPWVKFYWLKGYYRRKT